MALCVSLVLHVCVRVTVELLPLYYDKNPYHYCLSCAFVNNTCNELVIFPFITRCTLTPI